MEHEGGGNTNCNWGTWNDPKCILKGAREDENPRTSQDHSNNSVVEVSRNTKRPGDLSRLAVTQTTVKDHQRRKADVKNLQGIIILIIIKTIQTT